MLRLPGARTVGPRSGSALQPEQAAARPLRQGDDGEIDWDQSLFGYDFDDPDSRNDEDSLDRTMLGVVINPYFDWDGDRPPRTPYAETVIYEAHVKGMTAPPRRARGAAGTYAGLAQEPVIEHLKKLGVTAIELMPVHQFVHDDVLLQRGLRNYWGYNTIGFLAPHDGYAGPGGVAGQQVQEFKAMVKSFHQAGIEVILDVVYNHTAEGNHLGPTLSFKGIDNPAYYRLVDDDRQYYMDYTGTGNSLNAGSPTRSS